MPHSSDAVSREAAQGERMIEVKLRFWTNDLSDEGRGNVIPKHAWTGGVVRMERNNTHGIIPGPARPFHSLLDIGAVIERTLLEHGVVLHPSKRMRKYLNVPKKP